MKNDIYKYGVSTKKAQQFIDITHLIEESLDKSGINDGIITVYCPHTTAGITINENADPDVVRDILLGLDKAFPVHGDYRHFEGNSHAHIKASVMGASCNLLVANGNLILGRWQSVYFCEFDGPRNRDVLIRVSGD